MITAFRMGLAASGRGLCDIDRVLLRSIKTNLFRKSIMASKHFQINKSFIFFMSNKIYNSSNDWTNFFLDNKCIRATTCECMKHNNR